MPIPLILRFSPNIFSYVSKLSTQNGFLSQILNYERQKKKELNQEHTVDPENF